MMKTILTQKRLLIRFGAGFGAITQKKAKIQIDSVDPAHILYRNSCDLRFAVGSRPGDQSPPDFLGFCDRIRIYQCHPQAIDDSIFCRL